MSALTIGDGVFEVKSPHGDTSPGGDDWDQRIIDWLADSFKGDHGVDRLAVLPLLGHQPSEVALKSHRKRKFEQRVLMGIGTPSGTDLVFSDDRGTALHPEALSKGMDGEAAQQHAD